MSVSEAWESSLPRHIVDVRIDVDPSSISWPNERDFRDWASEGCAANHDFMDLRGISRPDAEEVLESEREIVMQVASDPRVTAKCFLENLEEAGAEFSLSHPEVGGIDMGVKAAVAALSAVGCAPFTSCAGHGDRAPHVGFYARPSHLALVARAASESGAGFADNFEGRIEVFGESIAVMLRLAAKLLELSASPSAGPT